MNKDYPDSVDKERDLGVIISCNLWQNLPEGN